MASIMTKKSSSQFRNGFMLLAAALALCWAGAAAQATVTYNVLSSFGQTNGSAPTSLIQGTDHNFYGTTQNGGSTNYGTVFEFATTNQTLISLSSFTNLGGSVTYPVGLTQKADGSFFGVSFLGGAYGYGTIFQIGTNNTPEIVYSFDWTNGGQPRSSLLYNPTDGNYYGTTYIGGTNGNYGTIYRLTSGGVFTSLFSFGGTNGNGPGAPLILGPDGNMYGTTSYGGSNSSGTVFRISTNGVLTSLFSFDGPANGANPLGGLVLAPDGLLYGTTSQYGTDGHGTIFRIDTNGNLTTLLAFNGTNGATPYTTLLNHGDGTLYGTTYFGGTNNNYGTIFRITTNGVFCSILSFGYANGAYPNDTLLQTADGTIYGTTSQGGANGYGTLFQLIVTPPQPPQLNLSVNGTSLCFKWNSVPNQSYQLQSTASLNHPNWTNNGPVITATGSTTTTTDSVSGIRLLYRLVVIP